MPFPLRKFIKDLFFVQSRSWLSLGIGVFTSIIMARALGPEGRGILALSFLLPGTLSVFLNLGVAPANVYHISTKQYSAGTVIYSCLFIWVAIGLIGTGIGICIVAFGADSFFPGVPVYYLYIALVTLPIGLLNAYLVSILQGQQRFREYNIATLALPVLELILILILVWWLELGVKGAVAVSIISSSCATGIAIALLWKFLRTRDENNLKSCISESFRYGLKSHLSNIMAFINYRADTFLVNFFLNPVATGIYTIAVHLAEKLWILSQGVSTVLLPKIGELNQDANMQTELTTFVARWVFIVTFPAAVIGWICMPFAINLMYGKAFIDSASPFRVLLIGIVLGASSRVFANALAAMGRPELNFYASILIVTINIVFNIILIPKIGIVGAAVATTIAYSVNFFFKIFLYMHVAKVRISSLLFPNSLDRKVFIFLLNYFPILQKCTFS